MGRFGLAKIRERSEQRAKLYLSTLIGLLAALLPFYGL
tara:strand:+ start:1088 stop:1201 length:114 start_codon:yes stop_codon:yes gene_type:complete